MTLLERRALLIINLAIEIFCDGKENYPCKKANSYPFIAKRHLSQNQNFQIAIHESLKEGWTTKDFQSHHCPDCSSLLCDQPAVGPLTIN